MANREKQIRTQIARQNEAVTREAVQAGARLTDSQFFLPDEGREDGTLDAVMKTVKLLTGGKFNTTSFQSFTFSSTAGRHVYIQPYSSEFAMPGEHHGVVEGSFDDTVSRAPQRVIS